MGCNAMELYEVLKALNIFGDNVYSVEVMRDMPVGMKRVIVYDTRIIS